MKKHRLHAVLIELSVKSIPHFSNTFSVIGKRIKTVYKTTNMNKIFAFLIFISGLTFSQTHRFFYELKFKSDSTQTEPTKKLMVLDINPKETKYYDNAFLEKDSINKKFNTQNTNWTSQIPVTRKRGSNKNTNFGMIDFQTYSYQTDNALNWKLTNETKKYQGLNLQKATTNFGGRKWTAWFTKDFPFSEGPYKFQGLPGLIIFLQDEKDNYNFSFVKNVNLKETYDTSNFLEVRYGNKPIPISEKILKEVSVHTLRHSFATHLLEDGMDILSIKNLLGHESIDTTLIYLQIAQLSTQKLFSPLDTLFSEFGKK